MRLTMSDRPDLDFNVRDSYGLTKAYKRWPIRRAKALPPCEYAGARTTSVQRPLLVIAVFMAALPVAIADCAESPTNSTAHSGTPEATPTSLRTTTSLPTTTSTTNSSSSPGAVDPCPSSFGAPPVPPGSQSLTPFLLETSDVPPGYVTTGATTSSPDGSVEFNGSLPDTVPVAYIAFSIDSNPGPGAIDETHEGIIEALAKANSTAAAVSLLRQTEVLVDKCGGDGKPVALPGSVPNLTAATELGSGGPQYFSSAIVFTTKGPYLLEVRWFNSNVIADGSDLPTNWPSLPTPAVMGSVADAALGRIPG